MMTRCAIRAVLGLALLVSTGCERVAAPTAPTSPPPATGVAPAPFTPVWPAVAQPARVYNDNGVLYPFYAMHGSLLHSRYVFYDDRRFGLQFASLNYPFFEYRGTYTEADGRVVFSWEDGSTGGTWGATAKLTDERLEVSYNEIMQHSDFMNGVYVRHR